jgi:hypothetical protein
MEINTFCAFSARKIQIQIDYEFNILAVDPGSDPMISFPKVNFIKTSEPSIVDIF